MLDINKMTEYTEPIKIDLEQFDSKLNDYLQEDSPLISSIARHLLKTRGKRIRPVFLFLSSHASDNFTDYSVDASLAIELIHTATLLHDDVVDESDMRRGQETVNAQWANLISVLMGDYIFAKAFRVMVEANSIELMRSMSKATERIAVGELRQIEETGNYNLSEDEYTSIIADKTAALFSIACEAGPILKKRANRERTRFALFGEKIGTAFQIADDLLDYVGEVEVTGKESGNDVMTGKVTLPLIHSLKKVNKASRREIIKLLKEHREESFEKINNFVAETGGIDYAYNKASELGQKGLDAISHVNNSIYYKCLSDMVNFTISRAS
ncbi:MAG: polyprenyl synthetase family protein [Candidatus Zixiibacteriota bacterium]